MYMLPAQENEQYVGLCGSEDDSVLFPAVLLPLRNFGYVLPGFRRPVAEAVVRWLNETAGPCDNTGEWEGDTLVLTDRQWSDSPDSQRIEVNPDGNGRYVIELCWVSEDDSRSDV